jgi:hypothetical protein
MIKKPTPEIKITMGGSFPNTELAVSIRQARFEFSIT